MSAQTAFSSIVPVILSGGSGTRLWPLSTPATPKQMLPLTAEQTMIQLTAHRTPSHAGFGAPVVVANARHVDMIERQLIDAGISDPLLILEPAARNTAPAIALAALAVDPDATLLVMPSDHVIADIGVFHAAIQAARPLVDHGWLVTFGITPDSPETGYGYIAMGRPLEAGVREVERFIEKPDLATAKQLLAKGGHAWNAGIFMFRADAYLDALGQFEPEMLEAARESMMLARRQEHHIYPDAAAFAACPGNSIDYAVMERARRVAVVPVSMGWSDVGSWDALHAISACDNRGNAVRGSAILLDADNCLVRSDGARVTLVGVSDLIVVATGDEILIVPRGASQDVKRVADHLKSLEPGDK